MKIRSTVAALLLTAVVPVAAACGTTADASDTSGVSSSTSGSATTDNGTAPGAPDRGRGGRGAVDVSSVTSEEQLIALIQEAYGDGGLGLHRGHQPVEDVLNEVLAISHEELHERMDAGQNLAAVAEDLGVDPQTLIDALVGSWSPAIDDLLASGAIAEDEADRYREALEGAFTFRVNWDGEEATPAFSGLEA